MKVSSQMPQVTSSKKGKEKEKKAGGLGVKIKK
jgi:hypothetical protein